MSDQELSQLPDNGQIEEFVRNQLGGREPEVDCDAALEEGWTLGTCLHPRGTAQLIACVANRLQNGESASDAWRNAWKIAERQCTDLGFELRELTGTRMSGQCDELWQEVADLNLDEMAQRNAEISENKGKEVGNRVCSIEDGPPTMGTEKGLTMAGCQGEEIADHHHHVSQGGGEQGFSNIDVLSMAGRDLDISCITYPDDDDIVMECADVQTIENDTMELLQESWDDYFPNGSMRDLSAAYDDIQDAKSQLETCTVDMQDMVAQMDDEWLEF